MAIKELEGFLYTCDRCGATHEQNNGRRHYANSCPPGWLFINAFKESRCLKYNLCAECGAHVMTPLEGVKPSLDWTPKDEA